MTPAIAAHPGIPETCNPGTFQANMMGWIRRFPRDTNRPPGEHSSSLRRERIHGVFVGLHGRYIKCLREHRSRQQQKHQRVHFMFPSNCFAIVSRCILLVPS